MQNAEMMKKVVDGMDVDEFKCVQTKYFQLSNLFEGKSMFVPISFDKQYTCLVLTTIHSSLIDFRFRPITAFIEATGDESIQTFMENGIFVKRKTDPD